MGITVSIPLLNPHEKFLPHIFEFYAENWKKHDLHQYISQRRALHLHLQGAVQQARHFRDSHILFTEDDHWNFPRDGLDVLLSCDVDVIGFQTYSRRYPYHSLAMQRLNPSLPLDQVEIKNMSPVEKMEEGEPDVIRVDLLSWAFTLVKTSVFDRINVDPFESWGQVPNDSMFCQACADVGIDVHCHRGRVIAHGEVTHKNRMFLQKGHEYSRALTLQAAATGKEETHA